MRRRGLRAIGMVGVCALAVACGDAGEMDESADAPTSEDSGTETENGDESIPGDACANTPLVTEVPGLVLANLRGASAAEEPLGCGLDGPVIFVEVHVEDRVDLSVGARGRGFVPRVALLRPGCTAVADDPERVLACAEALPTTLFDIGPDVELIVAVDVAPDDPALEIPAPDESSPELDPLEFELEIDARPVLAEGQACGPSTGRCESGTLCLDPPAEEPDDVERCRRPEADSCAAPGTLELAEPGVVVELSIAPEELHSDAHEHACAGWRRPERVDLLDLPQGLGPDARLEVRADDPRVGLALRGSTCLPEDALACARADASASATVLRWGEAGALAALAEAGESPVLFIELPRSDTSPDPLSTITVELEIVN